MSTDMSINRTFRSFTSAIREGDDLKAQRAFSLLLQMEPSYEICSCFDKYLTQYKLLEITPNSGFTLLHYFIFHGNKPVNVQGLIDQGASPITHKASPGIPFTFTALHEAAFRSFPELVTSIIEQGLIPIDAMDQRGIGTPLTMALTDESIQDVKEDRRNRILADNEKVIMHLLQYPRCAVSARICNLSRLLESKRGAAAKERFTREWLQKSYPAVHEHDNTWPPLILACTYCYLGIIEALLQSGADPNAPDQQHGLRPLAHLCSGILEHDVPLVKAARLLVEAGANPFDVKMGEDKQTALDIILEMGMRNLETEVMELAGFFLDEKKMNANAEDTSGRTLFARAIDRGSLDLAKKLYTSGGGPKLDEFKEMIGWTKKKNCGAARFIQEREDCFTGPQGPWADCTRLQTAKLLIELLGRYPELLDPLAVWDFGS
ncbi:hypothetical protein AU210_016467 [Fusarium oxysporum f. sp. radicis-cucumerinum]|uniref:Uncharacterized protein n=1 Tax=Fusarium oxysporum f. sp. radicis-cucumerinum TaxID=327505 RepID=A0A2H3FPJ4_FUSOX|nr:hypothetical protein AU210_016467 [Fusarium oxysporum f. sp. radicis-cucumerinum]